MSGDGASYGHAKTFRPASLLAPPIPAGLSFSPPWRPLCASLRRAPRRPRADPADRLRVDPLCATWGSGPARRGCSMALWRKSKHSASNRSIRTADPRAERSPGAYFLHVWRPTGVVASQRPEMMTTTTASYPASGAGTGAGPALLPVTHGYGRTRFDALESSLESGQRNFSLSPLIIPPGLASAGLSFGLCRLVNCQREALGGTLYVPFGYLI